MHDENRLLLIEALMHGSEYSTSSFSHYRHIKTFVSEKVNRNDSYASCTNCTNSSKPGFNLTI